MPRLNTEDSFVASGTFGYTGARIDKVGEDTSEATLVVIATDTSGSVSPFKSELEKCIQNAVMSCVVSPRAEQILIRLSTFNDRVNEFHGYRQLSSVNPSDYSNCLNVGGRTSLYDATIDAATTVLDYSQQLAAAKVQTNGIVFVITDGEDVGSTHGINEVRDFILKTKNDPTESLLGCTFVLVGVNMQGGSLHSFYKDAGFDAYGEVNNLDKLQLFMSKSISSQSQSLASGTQNNISGTLTI
jgi:uncharacterized protein YegL